MKRYFLTLAFLFLLPKITLASQAPFLFLQGQIRQGEFIFGFVNPDSKLSINNDNISLRSDGWFAFGIGRNDTGKLNFVVKNNGKTLKQTYNISPRKWKIQKVNGVPQNTVTPSDEEKQRITKEGEMLYNARMKVSKNEVPLCFSMPAKGRISSVFGSQRIINGTPKNYHSGLDIANKKGTPIYSPADGVVALVHGDMLLSGKTILITHGQDVATSYSHLSKITVNHGEKVKKGEKIGEIGTTGRSTGPHLHWTVTWKNKRVDPQIFIKNSSKFCPI